MRFRRRHSLLYLVYLRSPLWRLRRRLWILGAWGRCERCGSRRRLTVHHRTYQRLGHERRSDIEVLCWRCHHDRHHSEQRHGPLARLLAVRPNALRGTRGVRRRLTVIFAVLVALAAADRLERRPTALPRSSIPPPVNVPGVCASRRSGGSGGSPSGGFCAARDQGRFKVAVLPSPRMARFRSAAGRRGADLVQTTRSPKEGR